MISRIVAYGHFKLLRDMHLEAGGKKLRDQRTVESHISGPVLKMRRVEIESRVRVFSLTLDVNLILRCEIRGVTTLVKGYPKQKG